MDEPEAEDSLFVSKHPRQPSPSRVSRASNSSLVINEGFRPPVVRDFSPEIRFRHQFKALVSQCMRAWLREGAKSQTHPIHSF